eukprot:scaffold408068_cov35-Prasinocladus_malaysianus.AAC.1
MSVYPFGQSGQKLEVRCLDAFHMFGQFGKTTWRFQCHETAKWQVISYLGLSGIQSWQATETIEMTAPTPMIHLHDGARAHLQANGANLSLSLGAYTMPTCSCWVEAMTRDCSSHHGSARGSVQN